MATLIDHMSITLATGSRTFGPALIPNGLTGITLRIARCTTATPLIWPLEATRLTADLEVSTDGGQTYRHVCGITTGGGIAQGKQGEVVENVLTCLPLPAGSDRRVRVRTTVESGPLVSTLTVEVT